VIKDRSTLQKEKSSNLSSSHQIGLSLCCCVQYVIEDTKFLENTQWKTFQKENTKEPFITTEGSWLSSCCCVQCVIEGTKFLEETQWKTLQKEKQRGLSSPLMEIGYSFANVCAVCD
jgi:hypothetical protein